MNKKIIVHAYPQKDKGVTMIILREGTKKIKEFVPIFPEDYSDLVHVVPEFIRVVFKKWNFVERIVFRVQGYFPSLLPLMAKLRNTYGEKVSLELKPTEIDPRWDDTLYDIPGEKIQ